MWLLKTSACPLCLGPPRNLGSAQALFPASGLLSTACQCGPGVGECEGGVHAKLSWQMACGEGQRCAGLTLGLGKGACCMHIKVGLGVALPSAGIG